MTRNPARSSILLLSFLAAVLPAGLARPEEADVYLKDGRRLHGDVTQTDTEVVIKTLAGELRFPKDQVLRVVNRVTPDQEYGEKVKALSPGDVEGHYKLAEWAAGIERWDLVARQCRYVLGIDSNHRNAKVLLEEATRRQVGAAADRPQDAEPADDAPAEPVPLVSKEDMLRLKLYELSLTDPPEELRVRFTKKRAQTDLPTRFVREMAGKEGYDRDWERDFLKKKPFEQLQDIAGAPGTNSGTKYLDQIEINDEPHVFITFRRKVMPLIAKGCMRSGCHGPASSHSLRLPAGSRENDAIVYTTFALLDAAQTAEGPLINRDDPEASLLLNYMLPADGNSHPHPEVRKAKLNPPLRSTQDRNYDVVLDWISSLRVPHPGYELDYPLPARPTTRPATAPDTGSAAPRDAPAVARAGPDEQPAPSEKPAAGPAALGAAPASGDHTVVYRTDTGEKYHTADCPSLKLSKAALALKEARNRGLTPCRRCKPPQ